MIRLKFRCDHAKCAAAWSTEVAYTFISVPRIANTNGWFSYGGKTYCLAHSNAHRGD